MNEARRRLAAIEKRLRPRDEKSFRIVAVYGNEKAPKPEPGEDVLVLRVVWTPDRELEESGNRVAKTTARPTDAAPINGGGEITEAELEAQVKALERERAELKRKRRNHGNEKNKRPGNSSDAN